jgi:class 3 adenylate cyclase
MSPEQQRLLTLAADLEAQRALLGDAVVDPALAAVRTRLNALAGDVAGVDAVDAHQQTLKQLTIVFLDVVDSTRLSQRLDPEEIHAVMDGLLAACTGIVEVHGGKVLQYAGDSVLSVFGAAERARTTRSVRFAPA